MARRGEKRRRREAPPDRRPRALKACAESRRSRPPRGQFVLPPYFAGRDPQKVRTAPTRTRKRRRRAPIREVRERLREPGHLPPSRAGPAGPSSLRRAPVHAGIATAHPTPEPGATLALDRAWRSGRRARQVRGRFELLSRAENPVRPADGLELRASGPRPRLRGLPPPDALRAKPPRGQTRPHNRRYRTRS